MTQSNGESRIDAVVLAAGSSRRMGSRNKLLAPLDGTPVVAHTLRSLLATQVERVVVVTGHESSIVEQELRALFPDDVSERVQFVENHNHTRGMGSSIAQGVAHLEPGGDGVLVALGDMPRVRDGTIDAVIEAWRTAGPDRIAIPVFEGRRGHPVLFGAAFRTHLLTLEGDVGARAFLGQVAEHVLECPVHDPGVVNDVDEPADLESLSGMRPGRSVEG